MATYSGGLIFENTNTSTDIAGTTTVLYTVPSGAYYTEFKALSFRYLVTGSGTFQFFIENSDGAGGWARSSTALAEVVGAVTSGQSTYFSAEAKLFPGQRIVGVSATVNVRFNYSYNEYTPAA